VALADKIPDRGAKVGKLAEIARALAAAGEKAKASKLLDQTVAETNPDPGSRAYALGSIATAPAAGEKAKVSKLLDRAVAMAETIPDPGRKAYVLGNIATALATADNLRAVAVAETIPDPGMKAYVLGRIASVLATADNLRDARKVAHKLALHDRAVTLGHVLVARAEARPPLPSVPAVGPTGK
jgi:hypothetical protein